MSTSRPYHHGDLRTALLDAATGLAAGGDPEKLTLRAAARTAGVSHTAAYRHFADKQDLLRALALRGFDGLRTAMSAVIDDPASDIGDIAREYLDFARSHSVEFRLMFDRTLCLPDSRIDALAVAGREAMEQLRAALAARYALRESELDAATFAAFSQMHGVATLVLETPAMKGIDDDEADRMASDAARMLHFRSTADTVADAPE